MATAVAYFLNYELLHFAYPDFLFFMRTGGKDMSKVSFLASIGMRTLLSCAKAASARGGKMVLFNPQPMVKDVLETSGVASLIPMTDDLAAAKALLAGVH